MIASWDLWPWIVAEGAGELALAEYRMQRGIQRDLAPILRRLYPTVRSLLA